MAEPIVRLEPAKVAVDPGGQVSVVVSVFNPGNRVEGYDLDVVSTIPMPWATISPPSLSVYPQQEGSAVVTFAPPAGAAAPGGSSAFGIRARSQIDAALSSVAEGDLDVGAVAGLQAVLTPVTSSGRWSGHHTVKVSNGGNAAARLRITAGDPEDALGFLISPGVLDVPVAGEAVARMKVRTRRPTLRGSDRRLTFQVVCEPEEPEGLVAARPATSTPERPVVDGAFRQRPILTRAVVILSSVLLLAGISGLAYAVNRIVSPGGTSEEGSATPDTPTGFAVTGTTDTTIALQWNGMEDLDGFRLDYVDPDTGEDQQSEKLGSSDTTYDADVGADTEMCFQLTALRADSESDRTDKVCATTPKPALETPTGFAVTGTTDTTIALQWNGMEDLDGFRLDYVDPDTGEDQQSERLGSSDTTYDADVGADTEMCFQLTALRADSESDRTDKVCATTPKPALETPTGFAVTGTTDTTIALQWNGMEDLDGFRLDYVDPDTGEDQQSERLGSSDTTYDAEVGADTEMCFQLTALRQEAESDRTDKVCATTPDWRSEGDPLQFLTVIWSLPADAEYAEEYVRYLRRQLAEAGVLSKVLQTEDYDLERTAGNQPVSPLWIVYADAASAAESERACQAAWTVLEERGQSPPGPESRCVATYEVLGRSQTADVL